MNTDINDIDWELGSFPQCLSCGFIANCYCCDIDMQTGSCAWCLNTNWDKPERVQAIIKETLQRYTDEENEE